MEESEQYQASGQSGSRGIKVVIARDKLDWISVAFSGLGWIATIIMVFIALLSYRADQATQLENAHAIEKQNKKEASLRQIDQFLAPDMLNARNLILKGIMLVGPDQLDAVGTDQQSLLALKEAMANETGTPIEYDLALITIVDFFDALKGCLDADVCDGQVVQNQIGDYAARFHCFFQPAIISISKNLYLDNFGEGVKYWANKLSTCETL